MSVKSLWQLLQYLAESKKIGKEFVAMHTGVYDIYIHTTMFAASLLFFPVRAELSSNFLFQNYPTLQNKLSYISLGDFPTPIYSCKNMHELFPHVNLFIKHDGMTGKIGADGKRTFGGNKLRKLQYLLADAVAHGHTHTITFGAVGSNHALQTTVLAQQLGLNPICLLKPQPNSHVVQRNLLLQKAYGAQLCFAEDKALFGMMAAALCYQHKQQSGKFPYIIPVGGSCALGAVGYVEAAFELKHQIEQSEMPAPDRIYVTLGSGGTAAGLLLGLQAAGMTTKILLVIEEPAIVAASSLAKVKRLFKEANNLLRMHDVRFPCCDIEKSNYEIIDDCGGDAYGLFTPECVEAMQLMHVKEDIKLDGTYTGKCAAALVRDLKTGACDGQTVLFWNTFCGDDFTDITTTVDYHDLPQALHKWFEEDVQPLDSSISS